MKQITVSRPNKNNRKMRIVEVEKSLDVKDVAYTLANIITKDDAETYIREISEKSSKKDLIHE